MKKVVVLLLIVVLIVPSLTGCATTDIASLKNMDAEDSGATADSVSLSVSDKEAAVYAQVSHRQLLDLTTLEKVPEEDMSAVGSYMDAVDAQLTGTLPKANGVIDECFTNYLLYEFEKTPYYWQRSSMTVLGMDANSRSIVIDVTYKTLNGVNKAVRGDSYIVKGEPNYEQKLSVRYERYTSILSAKYSGYSGNNWMDAWNEFVGVYGNPSDIIASQQDTGLTDYTYKTGNQVTYSGMINSEAETSGAKMTVRYILVPDYTLGVNQGLSCKHMYITSYTLDNDPTKNMEVYTEEGSDSIADDVYDLLYSYYQCEDEDDFSGMYSLSSNFQGLDKHFQDYFNTTYRKHESFTVSIFNISGTTVTCGVTLSSKVRAKGSEMTFPIYSDKLFYTLELVDGKLRIVNEVLLSSTLEGEPDVNVKNADTTGFTSTITLSDSDKSALEHLISNFGVLQLNGDTTSDKFSSVVDTSTAESSLTALKEAMTSVTGVTKVTWIDSYLQGQSNYASIKCKELVQDEDDAIRECTVTYDFINKGNTWYIYGYTISSDNKLDTTTLTTKNSLCVVAKDGVDALNSQVSGQSSSSNSDDSKNKDIGIVKNYDSYVPTLKN